MRTAGVKQDQAKLLYFKLWALHIDARAESNRNSTKAVVSQETRSEKGVDGSKFQHGSFFRISAADDLPGSFVMVLGPSEPADRLRKTYVCADLEPIPELGFELLVARQKVMGKEKLLEKVDLKYIPENRCYRLPDD
jgi:kinesin family protein 2/24